MDSSTNKCRICLKLDFSRRLVPLFGADTQHVDRIYLISGLKVQKDHRELLPDKICVKCVKALRKAADLRNLCIDSDNILQNELKLFSWNETVALQASLSSDRLSPIVKNPFEDDFEEELPNPTNLPNDLAHEKVFSTPAVLLSTNSRRQKVKRQEFGFHSEFTVCDICGKNIKRNYIKDHIRTHDTDVKFHCDLCGLSFKIKGYLFSHMRNMHISTKRFQCNVCGKSFAKRYFFECHMRTHSENGRIFRCTFKDCTKDFHKKSNFIAHKKIHTNERSYTCSYCGKGFIHFTDHKRHVMGHTGERPYKCDFPECLRGFIKRSELTAHERTHRR